MHSPLRTHINGIFTLSLGVIALAWFSGCATAAQVGEYPNQQRMVGKSKAAILACAGKPVKEQTRNDVTLLQYYREAPMLEESAAVGKGSFPTIHHGCWATVIIAEDRVTEVRYRFAPPTFDASNDCEEIFEPCQ
ncbi:hypothetical protein ACO9S2_12345 [Nitrospira sp. NS4]|uniref:hypothetical protein n=1 Tax=Nitrospira sp. NS4 TaxID=3414498 RepID=UPI003C2EA481